MRRAARCRNAGSRGAGHARGLRSVQHTAEAEAEAGLIRLGGRAQAVWQSSLLCFRELPGAAHQPCRGLLRNTPGMRDEDERAVTTLSMQEFAPTYAALRRRAIKPRPSRPVPSRMKLAGSGADWFPPMMIVNVSPGEPLML